MKFHKMMQLGSAVGRNEVERVDALCKEALKRNPSDLFALGMLADTYWRNEQHEDALTFALRMLEITPSDFNALRIAADAYRYLGNDVASYTCAKKLCTAVPHLLEPHHEVSALLKPFSWIPSIRRLRQKALDGRKLEHTSRMDWAQWAQEYVTWYESRSSMEK